MVFKNTKKAITKGRPSGLPFIIGEQLLMFTWAIIYVIININIIT